MQCNILLSGKGLLKKSEGGFPTSIQLSSCVMAKCLSLLTALVHSKCLQCLSLFISALSVSVCSLLTSTQSVSVCSYLLNVSQSVHCSRLLKVSHICSMLTSTQNVPIFFLHTSTQCQSAQCSLLQWCNELTDAQSTRCQLMRRWQATDNAICVAPASLRDPKYHFG